VTSDRLVAFPLPGGRANAALPIETMALTRRFGDRLAVDGVDLAIEPGEIFGVLGPNGSGKTTTLRMLSTLIPSTSGHAAVLGHSVMDNPMAVRRLLGVMTERPGLYERLTVEANLRFWAEAHGLLDVERAIGQVLDFTGLAGRRHDRAGGLSKGLKQRVALARAVIHRPPVLLLDEPSSGLDPSAAAGMEAMIRELVAQGATVFMNTHRLAEAERLCDRVAILRTRLIAIGSPAGLRAKLFGRSLTLVLAGPVTPRLREAMSGVSGVEGLRVEGDTIDCTLQDTRRQTPDLVAAVVSAGGRVLEVRPTGDLEAVYMRLVDEVDRELAA
jgi:ABC-2 type transport system ATP-binding protein